MTDVHVVEPDRLAGYAPLAWARVLAGLISQTGADAVVAAGTDRGSEVLAHLGAITGLPMAANCMSAAPPRPATWQLVRQRWAGSLLEDAVLEASPALLDGGHRRGRGRAGRRARAAHRPCPPA